MEEASSQESIFNQTEALLGNPQIYDSLDQFNANYEINPSEEESKKEVLTEVFERTVVQVDNTKNQFTITSHPPAIEEERRSLPFPETEVIKKGDEHFYQIKLSPSLILVVNAKPIHSIMRNGKKVEGFEIANLLMSNDTGQLLDLYSLGLTQQSRNIFTFSGFSPFASHQRVYETENDPFPVYAHKNPEEYDSLVNKGGIAFGEEVLLSLNDKIDEQGNYQWIPDNLPLVALHENGHTFSRKEVRRGEKFMGGAINLERSANAQVLKLVKTLNEKYPSCQFFDFNVTKQRLHDQMIHGYGGLREASDGEDL